MEFSLALALCRAGCDSPEELLALVVLVVVVAEIFTIWQLLKGLFLTWNSAEGSVKVQSEVFNPLTLAVSSKSVPAIRGFPPLAARSILAGLGSASLSVLVAKLNG